MNVLTSSGFWYAIFAALILAIALITVRSYAKQLSQGCCGSGGDAPQKRTRPQDRNRAHYPFTETLIVDGMVCANCARRVENALNAVEGVWAEADVNTKRVTVHMKQQQNPELLRSITNGIGPYTVLRMQGDV